MTGRGGDLAAMAGTDEITILNGSSFCRSDRAGDIHPHRPHGIFISDTRVISTWELQLDDQPLEPLGVLHMEPFTATMLCRAASRTQGSDPTVVVERRRMIAGDVREDIVVRNYGPETLGATLLLEIDGDFADLFDVKEGRVRKAAAVRRHAAGSDLTLSVSHDGANRGVRINGVDATATRSGLVWRIAVPPHGEWRTTVEVLPSEGGHERAASFPVGKPVEETLPARRLREWRVGLPTFDCDDEALQLTLERSVADLGALRIQDPQRPDLDVVAAGAPWFMALFGRDALLTSWLTLPWDGSLARGTLHTLARLQGRELDLLSEEEPGKILHEVRLGIDESRALGGSRIYYGSVDATPLFVMLLERAVQWGLPDEDLDALLPAADRALDWIATYGDLDGDGFIEYQRKTDRGLLNQGWKDSTDSIIDRAGRPGRAPIALAEVQGYVYAAYGARARLAALRDDQPTAERYTTLAQQLRTAFNDSFWLPELGYYALALDGDKRPLDALASNQGHCLWTGIIDEQHADSVVAQLMSPQSFSGWGVRTLATSMASFNPISYHNGSVWPHDNALLLAGLMRYGKLDAAHTLASALIEASDAFGGRLPELFTGFAREQLSSPVPYPTSCAPQAWAAATPLGIVAELLQLTPERSTGRITGANALPEAWGEVRISGLSAGEASCDIASQDLQQANPSAPMA